MCERPAPSAMAHCSFIETRVQSRIRGFPFCHSSPSVHTRVFDRLSFMLLSASFKRLTHCQCAQDAVLVKTIPPVGPAE